MSDDGLTHYTICECGSYVRNGEKCSCGGKRPAGIRTPTHHFSIPDAPEHIGLQYITINGKTMVKMER